MSAPWRLLALVLVAVLVVPSCSDGDEADDQVGGVAATISAGIPESLDRTGYVAIANQICAEPVPGDELGDSVDSESSVEQIDDHYDVIERRFDQLRALPVPEGDEGPLDEIEQAHDRVLTALDELSTAVDSGDTQAAVVIASALDGLRSQVNELMSSYGIGSCTL